MDPALMLFIRSLHEVESGSSTGDIEVGHPEKMKRLRHVLASFSALFTDAGSRSERICPQHPPVYDHTRDHNRKRVRNTHIY